MARQNKKFFNKNIFLFLIIFQSLLCLYSCKKNTSKIPNNTSYTSWLPAADFSHALLVGNGEMGAMVFGNPHDETIIINHASLYLPQRSPVLPINQASRLEKIRNLCKQGEFAEAAKIPVKLSMDEGYGGQLWSDPYIPAFDLIIKMPADNVENYVRKVNFETGEAIISWNQEGTSFQRKVFTLRTDSIIIMEISSTHSFTCYMEFKHRPVRWNQWEYIGNNISKMESDAYENYLSYECLFKNQWNGSLKGYYGLGKLDSDGQISVEDNALQINDANRITLLLSVKPSYDTSMTQLKKKAELLLNSYEPDYNQLLEKHNHLHKKLFNRVSLNLKGSNNDYTRDAEILTKQAKKKFSPAFVEKQFYAARYNNISSTGFNPPNLQGIWGAQWTPPWSSDFTHDGNLPVAVSSYLSSNLAELMHSFTNYHERMLPYYRVNAKKLYNCRGIMVPSHSSTSAYNVHFNETWCLTFWTAGAGWAASYFYDYFQYTLDTTFLKEHAYPFMKEAALFYEDFLTIGANGKYIFNPSYSPENTPANTNSQATINATMDVMVSKQLLRNCIDAGKILSEKSEKIQKWQEMLTRMPEYEVDSNGCLREWLWPGLKENHNHRHVSQLYGLYDVIDPDLANDTVLLKAARKALNERMKIRRQDNGGIMVFGLAQMANVASNLEDREMVSEIIEWLSAYYWSNSLVTYHDPGGLFNMDLSGGFQHVIIKALLNSQPTYTVLLPGLPEEWPEGSIKGVQLRNQIEVKELNWSAETVVLSLVSEFDQNSTFVLPKSFKGALVKKSNGESINLQADNRTFSLLLTGNKTETITINLNTK